MWRKIPNGLIVWSAIPIQYPLVLYCLRREGLHDYLIKKILDELEWCYSCEAYHGKDNLPGCL